MFAGSVTASDGSQWQRQKTFRLAALCETSKQLQSRLQSETQRFHSDFVGQCFNSLLRSTVFTHAGCIAIGVGRTFSCICLFVCLSVCLFVRAPKGKWLELSAPKSACTDPEVKRSKGNSKPNLRLL